MTDADQASYWKGVAERALAKQHEYEAQLAKAREALEPLSAMDVLTSNKGEPEVYAFDPWRDDAVVFDIGKRRITAGDLRRAREVLHSLAPADGRGDVDLHDFVTHRHAWRNALVIVRGDAEDRGEDVSYWQHEIEAFDRAFDLIRPLTAPPVGSLANPADATPKELPSEAREDGVKVKVLEARIAEACYASLRRRGMSSRPHANELAQAAMSVVAAEIEDLQEALEASESEARIHSDAADAYKEEIDRIRSALSAPSASSGRNLADANPNERTTEARGDVSVKPLEWSTPAPPNDDCRYDHIVAATPWGPLQIEWKGWKADDSFAVYRDGFYLFTEPTLEAARASAWLHHETEVRSALTVPSTTAQTGDA